MVGQKAFGLCCLPKSWTLPFLGISAECFQQFQTDPNLRTRIFSRWSGLISNAAQQLGIDPDDGILVRSSGADEGIDVRGKFHSSVGVLHSLDLALHVCLEKLTKDHEIQKHAIPLVLQKRCSPERMKGHLSNERRCYEEDRDWMGQIESAEAAVSSSFTINLRHWREKPQLPQSLSCSVSTHVSHRLRAAAEWAYTKHARVHFEWVWDGACVYLVQADEETGCAGHNPIEEHQSRKYHSIASNFNLLRRVFAKDERAARFAKIANVFVYLRLGLPTAPLYILDDQELIKKLADGKIPQGLESDITELVKGSLVIRSDLATDDLTAKQLLPRTQEVRDKGRAIDWLLSTSKKLCKTGFEGAFLFHNFIPAQAAAFAYATPGEPMVQIESLWGLPEGLYYNAHDKYVVDTLESDTTPSLVSKFLVQEKRNFKHFFVSTTDSGNWETLVAKPPYDWKGSLTNSDAKSIALDSRRIADAEGHPISIMWFVGVPDTVSDRPNIPWYHEVYDAARTERSQPVRKKTLFDEVFRVRSSNDIERFSEIVKTESTIPRICVQPLDEKLLRDKNTLKRIGKIASDLGAIIVLEGALLSHAYYQLLRTGAIVEVVHPFLGFEEKKEFNKLVRDKVPDVIRQRGECITTATLQGEPLIRALSEKLVEESYELLDAKDLNSIVAELADVQEVMDALMREHGLSKGVVEKEQTRKRKHRGGFTKGIVLVETQTVLPTSKPSEGNQQELKGLDFPRSNTKTVERVEILKRSERLEKRTDRRIVKGNLEILATAGIPVVRSFPWTLETNGERIDGTKGRIVKGRATGVRSGSKWSLEIAVEIDDSQPELL